MNSRRVSRRGFLGVAAAGVVAGCCTAGHAGGGKGKIATFNADVTPPIGTCIYSSFEPLKVIEQPLQAKGVIIDDGTARYVIQPES